MEIISANSLYLIYSIYNPTALRKAKTVCSFGLSECNRVETLAELYSSQIDFQQYCIIPVCAQSALVQDKQIKPPFWCMGTPSYYFFTILQRETTLITSYLLFWIIRYI